MDVFSTELGIRYRFVKTLEFWGGGFEPPQTPLPRYVTVHRDGIAMNTSMIADAVVQIVSNICPSS
jgi:hypothetical protein